MANYNRLPDTIRSAVIAAYRAGEKTDAIAAQFNLSRAHPRQIARQAGIPPRVQWPKQKSSET
jgi:hypothetical protein